MSVELYEDDVWWKGLVLRKSPAGVFIYLPGGWTHSHTHMWAHSLAIEAKHCNIVDVCS